MNFLPVRVIDEGGLKLRLATGATLAVPPQRVDRYAPFKGREMTMGLRPEHLVGMTDQVKPGVVPLDAPVDVIEPMGMETLVHFFIDRVPVCARVDPAVHAAPGEMLPLAADMNQMHLIDFRNQPGGLAFGSPGSPAMPRDPGVTRAGGPRRPSPDARRRQVSRP